MYGVDQCRVCGKPITVPSKKARAEQEKTNRKPPIPEAEWRRRGYLTCPTPRQLGKHPAHGCCFLCGIQQQRKLSKPLVRVSTGIAIVLGVFTGVVALLTYMHH
jgi:hypothetical protein